MPLVSVILPVNNGENFLREAMDSILEQTFSDFELIVIDDGSIDSTPDILGEYAARDTRVLVKRQSRNLGIVEALNSGCRIASGRFIARMDADDICLPERLAQQITFLCSHPDVGVVGTNIQLIDSSGNRQKVVLFPEAHAQICWSLCFYNPIVHPSTMMRRDVLFQVGGYRMGYPNGEDYDLWRRIAKHARLANLSSVLLMLRKHASNLTIKYGEDNLLSGVQVAWELMSDVLGREISKNTLEILWTPNRADAGERKLAAALLEELSQEFIHGFTSSYGEKYFIIQDTASRLTSLALRKISLESIAIILKAITYSPETVLNKIMQGARARTKRIIFK